MKSTIVYFLLSFLFNLVTSQVIPVPGDCTKYQICDYSGCFVFNCGIGTEFNPRINVCDYPLRDRGACGSFGELGLLSPNNQQPAFPSTQLPGNSFPAGQRPGGNQGPPYPGYQGGGGGNPGYQGGGGGNPVYQGGGGNPGYQGGGGGYSGNQGGRGGGGGGGGQGQGGGYPGNSITNGC